MKTIEKREDVKKLVYTFYDKILKDKMLSPIFNMHLQGDDWPPHLEKMTDFWETNLFGIPKFRGNPVSAHARVDRSIDYGITEDHFAHWVEMWHETVDELFEGELAERAKLASNRMASGLFMAVWNQRPNDMRE
ncbi:MAG TPA: group III truncated hemoglobin [Brumimicrobium sp.]|nr:group III truncated hemoglobin [Brumimicrobium sp.]